MEQNKLDAIVEYYGEDSKEDRLLEYIEISEDLDGLDIGECIVSDNLYEKHNFPYQYHVYVHLQKAPSDRLCQNV